MNYVKMEKTKPDLDNPNLKEVIDLINKYKGDSEVTLTHHPMENGYEMFEIERLDYGLWKKIKIIYEDPSHFHNKVHWWSIHYGEYYEGTSWWDCPLEKVFINFLDKQVRNQTEKLESVSEMVSKIKRRGNGTNT